VSDHSDFKDISSHFSLLSCGGADFFGEMITLPVKIVFIL
jgi:hypothetical protein